MALDGAFLYTVKTQIEKEALNSRIEKIYQPSREEIVIALRSRGYANKLLLSAGADSPRIHFTKTEIENPKSPPMFCMLLRKHLNGGKLVSVRQHGLDRILYLDFETNNEFGDTVIISVAIEIMGRHSNIIVIGNDGKILDAIKRIDSEMSGVRPILPGITYTLPPNQNRLNLFNTDKDKIKDAILNARGADISKSISTAFEGFSAVLAREAVFFATRGQQSDKTLLTESEWDKLVFFITRLKENLLNNTNTYTTVIDQNGKPKDFSFVPLAQYGALMQSRVFETPSELLDNFYSERVRIERMKQRSNDLLKMLLTTTERISRKLALQKEELKECADREKLKVYGDLLSANLYAIKKGQKSAKVIDFYNDNIEIDIDLDPALTPVQNAQKYYKEYRKSATAEKMLKELIKKGSQELLYIDSVFDAVTRTSGESELLEIREELSEQGYIKNYKNKNKMLKSQPPLKYKTSDGYTVYCGRNNKQNDKLTLRDAKKEDIWMHTQGYAGSHVVIVTDGKSLDELPDSTVEEAAMIAAYNSKARDAALVPVDYTQIKNVKKPMGAKPGMVIFEHYFTLYVTPEEEKVKSLAI